MHTTQLLIDFSSDNSKLFRRRDPQRERVERTGPVPRRGHRHLQEHQGRAGPGHRGQAGPATKEVKTRLLPNRRVSVFHFSVLKHYYNIFWD